MTFKRQALLVARFVSVGGDEFVTASPARKRVSERNEGALQVWIGAVCILPDQALHDIRGVFIRPSSNGMGLWTGRVIACFVFNLIYGGMAEVDRRERAIVTKPGGSFGLSPLEIAADPEP